MLDDKRFWLANNAGALVLHALGIGFYILHGFDHLLVQLWALVVVIHILEIPVAFLAVREKTIPWGLTVINTLLFGFTWWVPTQRGIYHA